MDEAVSRAIERTVLASRCLDGARADVEAFMRRGGTLGTEAAGQLAAEALRVEQLAVEIARLEGA